MNAQRGLSADLGLAAFVDGVEEIDDQRLMRFMREGHGVGAAAGTLFGAMALLAPVLPMERQRAGRQHRGALRAGELDALGKAWIGDGGRIDRADGAVLE